MAKLNSFKTKMFQVKGKKRNGNGNHRDNNTHKATERRDDSLASRLDRKHEESLIEKETELNRRANLPVYNGQVLEDGKEEDAEISSSSTKWLEREFKCRRHIDHDSRAVPIS